jgi:hypothetical protein
VAAIGGANDEAHGGLEDYLHLGLHHVARSSSTTTNLERLDLLLGGEWKEVICRIGWRGGGGSGSVALWMGKARKVVAARATSNGGSRAIGVRARRSHI